jgi:hypothetical protein
LTPFLKGSHQTIDGWRENRDEYGWRMCDNLVKDELLEEQDNSEAPKEVTPVPRFRSGINFLKFLTQPEEPPCISVRPEASSTIAFIFGDASGHGFGTSEWVKKSEEGPGDDTIDGDYGTWTKEVTRKSSSNFRELLNLVLKLERMAQEGRLDKCIEIFMFTDNMVAEQAFFRGTSRSPTLFELIIRLTRLQMSDHVFLHAIWV